MTKTYQKILIAAAVASFLIMGALLVSTAGKANASAPSGLQATVATSSISIIGAGAVQSLFSTSTCAARIISTATSSIMLTFSDYANQSPSNTFGHWQAASTTVAYDSGLYGCGLVKAWSQNSAVVTLTETR